MASGNLLQKQVLPRGQLLGILLCASPKKVCQLIRRPQNMVLLQGDCRANVKRQGGGLSRSSYKLIGNGIVFMPGYRERSTDN